MKTAQPRRNNNTCEDCGTSIVMTKYQHGKLCPDCKRKRREGNGALKVIFAELRKRNAKLGITEADDDWSSQNVKTNDGQMFRHRRLV